MKATRQCIFGLITEDVVYSKAYTESSSSFFPSLTPLQYRQLIANIQFEHGLLLLLSWSSDNYSPNHTRPLASTSFGWVWPNFDGSWPQHSQTHSTAVYLRPWDDIQKGTFEKMCLVHSWLLTVVLWTALYNLSIIPNRFDARSCFAEYMLHGRRRWLWLE